MTQGENGGTEVTGSKKLAALQNLHPGSNPGGASKIAQQNVKVCRRVVIATRRANLSANHSQAMAKARRGPIYIRGFGYITEAEDT